MIIDFDKNIIVEEIIGLIINLAFHVIGEDLNILNMYFTNQILLTYYLDTDHICLAYPDIEFANFRNIVL